MKRLWRFGAFALATLLITLFAAAPRAHADVNDFEITDFKADYTLSKHDPQGELSVTETIAVNFHDYNHGILRAIPQTYKGHSLQIHVHSVQLSTTGGWSTYESNGNVVLKIGDADHTVTGPQRYVISYTVQNVISFYSDQDELYWDINGDQWGQTAEHVAVTLHLPDGLKMSSEDPRCYAGTYGSTGNDCTVYHNANTREVRANTLAPLSPYQTLTIVTGFEKGFFRPSKWYETVLEHSQALLGFFVPFLVLGGTAGYFWFRFGRDPKGLRTIVPEYGPPDNLIPIEVGTIVDFKTDNRDITATIIDLAVRRYITIIEKVKNRPILKDIKTYSLRLDKDSFSGLKEYEVSVLKAIFPEHKAGAEVELSDMKYKFDSTASALRIRVKKVLTDTGYFEKSIFKRGKHFGWAMLSAYVLAFIATLVWPAAGWSGLIAGTVVVAGFAAVMPSRTPKGVEARRRINGLKMYLKTAEADRIKMLQSPNAPYMPKSPEPSRSVDLFEKLLPYAMVLQVEEDWAKQFKDLYQTPPDWYQGGNWSTFNAIYLATALNAGVSSAVNTAFSSPSNSSSSGFGGGGFSGGGGGGGGGGGW